MTEISGKRGLEGPPCSAAVDSNTAISSSSSKAYPHGEDKDSAMFTYNIQRQYAFQITVNITLKKFFFQSSTQNED